MIQACLDKGVSRFQRGDNHQNVKIGWGSLFNFFSRTIELLTTELLKAQNYKKAT
jgi:hypothetical protein